MRDRNLRNPFAVAMAATFLCVFFADVAAAQCFFGVTSNKTKLYLYFPTASDATFPEYDPDAQTSPLEPFNVADLDATIGTTAQLRNRIIDIVKEDYCEFDVEIASTTTAPSPAEAMWQIVGIGSDDESPGGDILFGVAQDVDTGNDDLQDYSRVYAKSFLNAYGAGEDEPALGGASSTLERWATAIGHTTSHEAGHNFGLTHGNSAPRTGEDERNNHIMATGSTGLTGEMRAGRNRHFSDTSYEILGHNLGLRIKTLVNWDFINPNAENAHSMVMTLLSPAASLTLNWFYNGGGSPWRDPVVAASGTQSLNGTTYNKFTLTFSTAKSWDGPTPGVVPGGTEFHTGATFAESDLVIVYEVRLRGSGGANLNLHPRLIGFDDGTADMDSGDFNIRAFGGAGDAMIIEDMQVQFLPRMASIESMIRGAELEDIRGIRIAARPAGDAFRAVRQLSLKEPASIRIANFRDKRFVDTFYEKGDCKPGMRKAGGTRDAKIGEKEYCPEGWALSLFPSTYVYVVATIVDPNAKYWDKAQAKYVTGPLKSKVFYQFAGTMPDFNKNGIDDLIDLRTKKATDRDNNGIIDVEAVTPGGTDPGKETGTGPGMRIPWKWWWWVLILLLVALIVWALTRKKTGTPV